MLYADITISENKFQTQGLEEASDNYIIYYEDGDYFDLTQFHYSNNIYHSTYDNSKWFRIDDYGDRNYSFTEWQSFDPPDHETSSSAREITFVDSYRTLATYHGSIGETATYESFIEQAKLQSKDNWREEYTALPIICLLYTSPSPRDGLLSRMPSSA